MTGVCIELSQTLVWTAKKDVKEIYEKEEQILMFWDILDKRERIKKFFCDRMFVDPSKKGSAFMPVSASGGIERYADFAPLGLPKIQHFCFLFAILSHKLISIVQKRRFAKNLPLFAFICKFVSQKKEGLPKIQHFCF